MKQLPRINGAGDLVHMAAKLTGVEKVTKYVEKKTGKSCGCNDRRQKLNQYVPFRRNRTDELQPDTD